jgi:hypothetical protein
MKDDLDYSREHERINPERWRSNMASLTEKLFISHKELGAISKFLVDNQKFEEASNMRLIEDSFVALEAERDELKQKLEETETRYLELKEAYDHLEANPPLSVGDAEALQLMRGPREGDT